MICKNCGNEVSDGAKFCDSCGNAFINNNAAQSENYYNTQYSNTMYNTTPNTFSDSTASNSGITLKKFLFITIPVFVSIILILISIIANILIVQETENELREQYARKMSSVVSTVNDCLKKGTTYISKNTELYSEPSFGYTTGKTFIENGERKIYGYKISVDEEYIDLWLKVDTEEGYYWVIENMESLD